MFVKFLVVFAAIVAAGFHLGFRYLAVPEHAVLFAVERPEAEGIAATFLRDSLGVDVADDWSSTVFTIDGRGKTFLEKEVGVVETSALATPNELWHFTTRFFRPLRTVEHHVAVAPDGRVVGYRRVVDEAASATPLSREAALALATDLAGRLDGRSADWRLIEATNVDRPARVDWRFTWESPALATTATGGPWLGGTTTRFQVVLHGDQLGLFRTFLSVPEAWGREYARIRSQNGLAQTAATVLGLLPLILAMIVVAVIGFARRDLRPRGPLVLAATAAVLTIGGTVNELPQSLTGYATTTGWDTYAAEMVVTAALGGGAQGGLVLLAALAGERLYRRRFPNHLSLDASLSWRGLRTRQVAAALAIGGLAAPGVAAFQTLYYLAGRAVGIWTPAEVRYDSLQSTLWPALYLVSVSYNAAAYEELALRFFGVPLLWLGLARLLPRPALAPWVAIGLTAVVWGFLHSNYPQDPFYGRGIEIGFVGALFGWLMLRWGLLAVLSVHFSLNAFVIAAHMVSSRPTHLAAFGFALLPLGLAAVSWAWARWQGGFQSEAGLRNGDAPSPGGEAAAGGEAVPAAPRVEWVYRALSRRRRMVAAGLGLAGLVLHLAVGTSAAPSQPFRFDRDEAIRRADQIVARAGVDPHAYRRVATVETRADDIEMEYLAEVGGRGAVQQVYGPFIPEAIWQVRYARPLQRDEVRVQLWPHTPPNWPPFAVIHDHGESTPGTRLTQVEARALALERLLTVPGWAVENARLVDEGSVTRVGRSDHRFVFERTDARIADATLRAEIFVIGGRVSGYRPFVKVPEEWIRARAATTPQDVVALVLRAGTALTLVTLAALSFLRLARGRDLAVRPALLVALGFALWALIGEVNALPLLFRSYFTAVPPDSYVLTRVARLGVDLVQESLLAGAAAALVIGLWRRQVAPAVVPTVGRGVWAFDAALLSASMALTLLGLMAGVDALGLGTGAAAAAGVAWQAPVGAGTLFPAVASIAEARWVALRTLILFGGYLLVRGVVRRERWTLVASLLLPLISILTARSGPRALEAGLIVFGLIGLAIAARWFLRANLPAYFGAAIMLVLLVDSEGLLRHDHWWYGANGLALVGSMALALLAVLVGSLPVRGFGPDEATRPAGAPA